MFGDHLEQNLLEQKEEEESEQKLLIPWIISSLDQKSFKDFRWYNKKKKIFQVPWSHKSANHWSPGCVAVPAGWAKYKGKYVDRKDDYKKLKSTFRCALNSRRELIELKEKRTKRFRYWMLLPENHLAQTAKKIVTTRVKTKHSCKELSKMSTKTQENQAATSKLLNSVNSVNNQGSGKVAKRRGRPKKNQHVDEAKYVQEPSFIDFDDTDLQFCNTSMEQPVFEKNESFMEETSQVLLPPFHSFQKTSQEFYYPPSPPQDMTSSQVTNSISTSYSSLSYDKITFDANSSMYCSTASQYDFFPTHPTYFRSLSETPPPDYIGALFNWQNDQNAQEISQDLLTIDTNDLLEIV